MFYRRTASLSFAALAATACSGAPSSTASDTQAQSQALATDSSRGERPKGPGPRGPHGPPPEAFDACASKSTGAACNVKFGDKNIDGTCRTPPPSGAEDARTFCLPKDMPPRGGPGDGAGLDGRPHHAPPAEAFAACDGKAGGATCSVKLGDRSIDGTCRTPPPDSGETRLACVPAQGPGRPRDPR